MNAVRILAVTAAIAVLVGEMAYQATYNAQRYMARRRRGPTLR